MERSNRMLSVFYCYIDVYVVLVLKKNRRIYSTVSALISFFSFLFCGNMSKVLYIYHLQKYKQTSEKCETCFGIFHSECSVFSIFISKIIILLDITMGCCKNVPIIAIRESKNHQ